MLYQRFGTTAPAPRAEFANRKNTHCASMADLGTKKLADSLIFGWFSSFPRDRQFPDLGASDIAL
jgi:hypothetical protein